MPFSRDEGLCSDSPCIDPALFCAPTGDSTLEATIGDNQGWTACHHSYDASLPSHFRHPRAREALLVCFQLGPQASLPIYEVSVTRFPVVLVQSNVLQAQPHGIEGRVASHDSRCGTSCRAEIVCTVCNRGFGRAQELARHQKDVHEQSRRCLFCGFRWTRPVTLRPTFWLDTAGNSPPNSWSRSRLCAAE